MIGALAVLVGLIVTFLVIVVVHELGHYWAAKAVGVKPEVFSVGFGKTLWSRTSRSGVVWRIAAFPLGGSVRFVGDENAASLSTMPDGPALPGSLRAASKPRQAIVVFAGPLANFVLTVLLLSIVPLVKGETAYPWTVDSVALPEAISGLETGDELLAIGATPIRPETTQDEISAALTGMSSVTYLVRRDGKQQVATGPRYDLPLLGFIAPDSPAEAAGFRVGDYIKSIDADPVTSWSDLQSKIARSEGQTLEVGFARGEEFAMVDLTPKAQDDRWLIGVGGAPLYTLKTATPSLGTALDSGVRQTWALLKTTTVGFAASVVGKGDPCALDGPLAIGRVAGQAIQLGADVFLTFMAVISLGLGLLNLLPIPILDGGHLLMLGVEGATGRQVGKRLQAVLFIGGVTLIAYLMLTATINDLVC